MPAPLVRSSARRFDLPDGTIVLHPGCKPNWPWKRWHGFADLAAELASVAIVGTEQDRHHARTYFGRMTPWPAHARDYTGELSLPDTAALIAQSAALVSNDSGLMHLGVAVGTPTFGIFGITNPAREIIPAPHMHVLTKGLPCEEACRRAPYGRRDCDRHLQCLKELTAAEVVRTMNLLMPIKRPTRPSVQRAVALPAASNLLTVAIQLEGGLGDIITASSFIEALHLELGDCAIDVFHHTPDWPKFVFRDARFVRGMFANNPQQLAAGRYDIVVHLPQFVRYQVRDWARLTRINPDAARCLRVAAERFEQYRGLFERRPHLDGLWGRLSVAQGRSARSNLAWLGALSDADRPSPFLALDPSVWEGTGHLIDDGAAGYITLHDGFDITQPIEAGGATKCWPIAHWAAFAARFRQAFPDIRMVQLGAGKSRPLPGVDLNLIGRTDLHQSAWLLKHAMLHVDTDSGLVHLANAVHTQAVALFGPTDAAYYGHSANRNICSESCNNCWWSTPDWLARCPRGLSAPECMTSITPDRVFEEARQAIGRREAPVYRLVAAQLYDGAPEANRDKALATIFETLDMPPVQITRHVTEPNSGLYMHASKQWEYPFVLRHIEGRGGLDIADVGGGRGALAPCLAKLGHRVEVFDRDYLWDSGADVGIEARHRRWARTRGYAARFGSLYNLPAETAGYDAVLSVSVIEHVCAKALALRELLRLLKPGGLLIMTFDFALSPTDFQDDMRREIFGPALLAQTLATLGIAAPDFPAADIAGSAERIQHDGVLGIPEGMTVGGIVIRREAAPADGA
jgi:ADP-heptose:LPS heptosyltransferase/SAM-dependent methyltransferase